jgi:hypothetical protein
MLLVDERQPGRAGQLAVLDGVLLLSGHIRRGVGVDVESVLA